MINKLNKAKIALRENSGSGVVSVLIAMMFLTILGVMMLYMTYTGFVMKVTEREGTDNFYEAEAAMNVIKAEVQTMVSDTISLAYHDVMSNYSGNAEETFQTSFLESIFEYTYIYTESADEGATSNEVESHLFPEITSTITSSYGSTTANYYDADTLVAMIEQAALNEKDNDGVDTSSLDNITISVASECQYSSTDKTQGSITISDDQISLNGICVTYTNPDTGYSTTIQTDIVCKVPEFYTSSLAFSVTTVPNFALIANADINTATAAVSLNIEGNAYGGSLTLGGSATNPSAVDSLTLTEGTLIIAGDTTLSNRSTLSIGEDAELWTSNIILEGGSYTTTTVDGISSYVSSLVEMSGTVYVADDLELNGDYTMVEVPEGSDGAYYGFGSGDDTADESSAIVINGRYTQLNLDGISDLMLAGYSFIDTTTSNNTSGVLMGESVSVKSNQLLYLAPVEILQVEGSDSADSDDIEIGNPAIDPTYTVSTTPNGDEVNGVDIPAGTTILTLKYTVGTSGSSAHYYYLKFDSAADANQYFIDYFTANPEAIEEYIGLYTDSIQLPDDGVMSGSALEVTKDGDELITSLVEPSTDSMLAQMRSDASAMSDAFMNLTRTLSTTQTSTDSTMTPYQYVVETGEVDEFLAGATSGTVYNFYDEDGTTVVAKLIYGDYTVSETNEPAIILATGTVTVSAESYSGLIIAGKDITISTACKSITADKDAVTEAFQGIYTITDTDGTVTEISFYTFLNADVVGSTDSSSKSDDYTWNLDELVIYDDWSKS